VTRAQGRYSILVVDGWSELWKTVGALLDVRGAVYFLKQVNLWILSPWTVDKSLSQRSQGKTSVAD